MPLRAYAHNVMQRCDQLATISQHSDYIDRRYLSVQHKQANELVASWMREANMRVWQDEAGNQWGRYVSSHQNAKSLVIGSHLDTVPNSGKYDGILGVLLPLSYIQYLHDNHISLPYHIDIVGFADEEGTRFGTTLLGSRAVAGTWQDKWASLKDNNEISIATAMRTFGLEINNIHNAAADPDDLLGFLEIHIEQGPVLESKGASVGVVTGIAGAKRFNIEVTGHAGHAGTVPMALRQDALVGSAEMLIAIERLAIQSELVATVGKINSASQAVNVISGHVEFSLDIRSLNNEIRDDCLQQIELELERIAQQRGLVLNIKQSHEADATPCHPEMISKLVKACEQSSMVPHLISSGAGHDAMALAHLCPMGMLFVRCEKGVSHHPEESITTDDVVCTLDVLRSFCEGEAQKLSNTSDLVA